MTRDTASTNRQETLWRQSARVGAVLVIMGAVQSTEPLLANYAVEALLVFLEALTVLGFYLALGTIWNLPMPGPKPAVKHRSAWWYSVPLLAFAGCVIWTVIASASARKSALSVPSLIEVGRALAAWPLYAAFLVIVLVIYGIGVRKRVASVATLQSALDNATSNSGRANTEAQNTQTENANLRDTIDVLTGDLDSANAALLRSSQTIETLRDRAHAADALQRQLADAPSRADFDKALGERDSLRARWSQIEPFVVAAHRVEAVALRLAAFVDEIEANMPPSGAPINDVISGLWEAATEKNKVAYDARFRQELVRLTADLRAQFGLAQPALAEDKLMSALVLPEMLIPMVAGLTELRNELMKLIAREALK